MKVLYWNFWTSFWQNWADSVLSEDQPADDSDGMTHKENVLRLADIAPNPSGPEADPDWCARAEFLANMNHDLRTPLNAVIGFAQIIESEIYGKIGPQYLEYARHIQESGYDLLGKIEDLLKAAETEREMVAGELEEMDALHPTRQLAIAD